MRRGGNGKFRKTGGLQIFEKNVHCKLSSAFVFINRPDSQGEFMKPRSIALNSRRTLTPRAGARARNTKRKREENHRNTEKKGNCGHRGVALKRYRGESTSQRGGAPRIYVARRKLTATEAPNISERKKKTRFKTSFHSVL